MKMKHINNSIVEKGGEKMSNYEAIKALISQTSGQKNTLTIPKIYVELTGDLTTALLLNQIVFYSDKSKRNDGYFYKTYKEWEKEILLTERQVRNSANKLKKTGLIETKVMKANGSPTVHYKLNYDKLVDLILTKCQIRNLQNVRNETDKTSESLTEEYNIRNTTEDIYIREIYEHWNSKGIIKHRKMNAQMKSHINARLKEYSFEELKKAIDNYATVLNDDKYYWTHRWTLNDFMKPGNVARFVDEAEPLINFLDKSKRNSTSRFIEEVNF